MINANRQRGLTLIETLVALLVMGLTTVSILVLVGQNTRFAMQANERMYASVAVDNEMVKALIYSGRLETGTEEGDATTAGREFKFRKTITETAVPGLIRIDIEILSPSGQVLARAQTVRKLK